MRARPPLRAVVVHRLARALTPSRPDPAPPPPHHLRAVATPAHDDGGVGDADARRLAEVGQAFGKDQRDAQLTEILAHQAEGGSTGGFVAHCVRALSSRGAYLARIDHQLYVSIMRSHGSAQARLDVTSNYHSRNFLAISEIFANPSHISRELSINLVSTAALFQFNNHVLTCRFIFCQYIDWTNCRLVLSADNCDFVTDRFTNYINILHQGIFKHFLTNHHLLEILNRQCCSRQFRP